MLVDLCMLLSFCQAPALAEEVKVLLCSVLNYKRPGRVRVDGIHPKIRTPKYLKYLGY